MLEGSTLHIEGTASKGLRVGQVVIRGCDNPRDLTVDAADRTHFTVTIPVPGSGWKSLAVHLVGSAGDGSVDDPEYPIELLRDHPPTVTITQPKDETVTVISLQYINRLSDLLFVMCRSINQASNVPDVLWHNKA